MKNNYYDVTTGKQAELSPLQKMYLELEKIIEPRLLDDFCGYNEETQGFDIVLATKEIIEAKEQECDKLKFNLKGTGILGLMKRNVQLRKALDEIEKLMPKFEDSTECAYGDFDCENCSSLDEDTVCTYKLKKIILDIINKAKEKIF